MVEGRGMQQGFGGRRPSGPVHLGDASLGTPSRSAGGKSTAKGREGSAGKESRPAAAALLELEALLADHLDTSVTVSMGAAKGRIQVEFADIEDLERIYRRMSGS